MDNKTKSIVIGSVLGDGFLTRPSGNGSRLWLKYNDKSLPYLKWLYKNLKSLGVSKMRTRQIYNQHYFLTNSSKELAKLRDYFYPKGKKIIPANIQEALVNPLSLAIWYMDDGTLDFRYKYHRNASIATFCFSYKECELLAKTLKINFGIEARVHLSTMRGKKYYRLYIISESVTRFMNIIKDFIVPCMRYKIL